MVEGAGITWHGFQLTRSPRQPRELLRRFPALSAQEAVERVLARQDVLNKCKRCDLSTMIAILGPP